mmetsp:Transcript_76199/g.150709  ORF Transcript_76199/g.150709 Transcript_76199/m.150709 type:complete len:207 (-) Transcript_76199:105-725(-)
MSKRSAEGALPPGEKLESRATAVPLPSAPVPQTGGGPGAGGPPTGSWCSSGGTCKIARDMITNRPTFEEPLGDGGRLHGWLDPVANESNTWQGSLALLPAGRQPWYGPSFGEPPEIVGSIQVRTLPDENPAAIETRIRVKDEDEDWQKPVRFQRKDGEQHDSTLKSAPKINWTDSKIVGEKKSAENGKEESSGKEESGDKKRTRTA